MQKQVSNTSLPICLVALVALFLAGCTLPFFGQESVATASDATNQDVTIKWFMRWDQARVDNVALPVIEAFEKLHPNIKVDFENVSSADDYNQMLNISIAAGTAPDVLYPSTHIAYALATKGSLLTLNEYTKAAGMDLSRYDPSILELYQLANQQYCLPIDTAALAVFYNKDMFDQAGVAYPQAGWNWDDFLTTAKALTADLDRDGQTDRFGVDRFVNYWPILVWTKTGHALFDDLRKPTRFLMTDPEAVEAVQWLANLINEHGVMPTSDQVANVGDMFVASKAAMQVVGHWRVPTYLANADFAFDFAPLPIGKVAANRADGSCFAISAASAHPQAAWEFVQFLSGPNALGIRLLLELQQMTPAIIDYQQDDVFLQPEQLLNTNKVAFLAGKEHLFSLYDPIHPVYTTWDDLWKEELEPVWQGTTTAADAFARMTPEVEKMLANLTDYE